MARSPVGRPRLTVGSSELISCVHGAARFARRSVVVLYLVLWPKTSPAPSPYAFWSPAWFAGGLVASMASSSSASAGRLGVVAAFDAAAAAALAAAVAAAAAADDLMAPPGLYLVQGDLDSEDTASTMQDSEEHTDLTQDVAAMTLRQKASHKKLAKPRRY